MTTKEKLRLIADPVYFAGACCQIEDSVTRSWVRFGLWPEQARALAEIAHAKQVVILKARQLGFTWLALSYALHQMIFHPAATVMVFSVGEREAEEAVGHRLQGMYNRLPEWLQAEAPILGQPSLRKIELANGSRAMSFPSSAGVSYTATLAIVDEADKGETDNLGRLLANVKPTVDGGGQLVILSTVEKRRPLSVFKNIYRTAMRGESGYLPLFLPWSAHPGRTAAWYAKEMAAQTASLGSADAAADYMSQEYPATAGDALAPTEKGRRIPSAWLNKCFYPVPPLSAEVVREAPAIPGLQVFVLPEKDPQRAPVRYVISADPAEGNPNSDDSACHAFRVDTGEEVAMFAGKHEPAIFANYINQLGTWYNKAPIMVERNNHGHAVILWLREHSRLSVMDGHDDKPGWLTSEKGKSLLYATACDLFKNEELFVHSRRTYEQLSSIEGNTQRAPEGLHDDLAMSFVLGAQAVMINSKQGSPRKSLMFYQKRPKVPAGVFFTDRIGDANLPLHERIKRL